MPPTLEIINEQMKNLEKNFEATNTRNLQAIAETEKRNLARHEELKCMLERAINKKADISEVEHIKGDVLGLETTIQRLAWIVITAVLVALISLVVTH